MSDDVKYKKPDELMSREDFMRGWLLLLAQPFGRAYANDQELNAVQFHFYYKRLGRILPELWFAVCETYAAASKWPSVDELRQTINQNLPQRLQLPQPDATEKPMVLILCDAYQRDAKCTARQSHLMVLPKWLAKHQEHPDAQAAMRLLESARRGYSVVCACGDQSCVHPAGAPCPHDKQAVVAAARHHARAVLINEFPNIYGAKP